MAAIHLEAPWSEVFDLMWDAYSRGTIPVGAVITDASGDVVIRGQNRIYDVAARELSGSRLAHAEVNALVQLGTERTYEDLSLFTALEPCHLCLSAAITCRVGTVLFASQD